VEVVEVGHQQIQAWIGRAIQEVEVEEAVEGGH
jgi:hypothetical protein